VLPSVPVAAFAFGPMTPNPGLGAVRIPFALARETHVRLHVLDGLGRSIAVLADGLFPPGPHEVIWNSRGGGGSVPAGIYFVCCQAGGNTFVRRLAMLR